MHGCARARHCCSTRPFHHTLRSRRKCKCSYFGRRAAQRWCKRRANSPSHAAGEAYLGQSKRHPKRPGRPLCSSPAIAQVVITGHLAQGFPIHPCQRLCRAPYLIACFCLFSTFSSLPCPGSIIHSSDNYPVLASSLFLSLPSLLGMEAAVGVGVPNQEGLGRQHAEAAAFFRSRLSSLFPLLCPPPQSCLSPARTSHSHTGPACLEIRERSLEGPAWALRLLPLPQSLQKGSRSFSLHIGLGGSSR